MPCRYYYWPIIFLFISCIPFLKPHNDFKKAQAYYQKGEISQAIRYFNLYYSKHPDSDTTLYYLFRCYKKLNNQKRMISTLEQLMKIGKRDKNVVLNLAYLYHKEKRYTKLYNLIKDIPVSLKDKIDDFFPLTRRLFAELMCGAVNRQSVLDPMVYVMSHNYLPILPNGKFYDNDTITNGNLIIILDRFLQPSRPKKFYRLNYISSHSYLYLPYMRLVEQGILNFNPAINPEAYARTTMLVRALDILKQRGLID